MFSAEARHLLELLQRKHEVFAESVAHLLGLPEVRSRCSVLLESLQEELRTTGAEIQAFLGGGPPAPQHDYVVEFYDGKVRQLEALLDEHARERTQAAQLRVHVQELERALGDKEQDRLRHLQAAAQLRQERAALEQQARGERAGFSLKLLELNRGLDETKLHFLELVRELEADNQRLREEAAALAEQLAAKEHELLQLSACREEVAGLKRSLERSRSEQQQLADWRAACEEELGKSEARVRQLGDDLEGKLRDGRAEVAELEQQNSGLAATVDRLGGGLRDLERALEVGAMRLRQLEADKRLLLDEAEQRRADGHSLAARLRASAELAEGRAQELEEGRALLEEAYRRIEQMERGLEEARAQLAGEQQRHQQQKEEIRAEYEDSIAQLVRVAAQLEAESRAKQDRASQLGDEVARLQLAVQDLGGRLQSAQEAQAARQARLAEAEAQKCLLAEEAQSYRGRCEGLEQQLGEATAMLQQLAAAKEELRKCADRFHSYEKELCGAEQSAQKQLESQRRAADREREALELRLRALHEETSRKTLELAALATRNRALEEEAGLLKRQAAIDSARQEARLHELERMLREKRDFEMKVTQLYV